MASEDNNFASPSNHAPNDNELVTANAAIEMASGDSNFASPIDQAPNDDELVTANATNHDQAHTGLAVGSRLQGTMSHVGEHFHNLGPINHTTYSIVYQVKTNIVTAFQSVVARARAFFPNIVSTIKESFKAAVARFRETFGEKFEKAPRVLLESTKEAVSWAKANPGKTVLLLISGVGIIVPSLVVGPALAALGFGATGVAAGSVAAGIHAVIGAVAAGSIFAILQSAGAGGAGLFIVNGFVQCAGIALGCRAIKEK